MQRGLEMGPGEAARPWERLATPASPECSASSIGVLTQTTQSPWASSLPHFVPEEGRPRKVFLAQGHTAEVKVGNILVRMARH